MKWIRTSWSAIKNSFSLPRAREFFIDNLLVQIHYIIVVIRWAGLAPWEFEFPFPGSLTSTLLDVPGPDVEMASGMESTAEVHPTP